MLAGHEAVVEGERRRRPILMTTVATVLGLIPLAIGLGEGAEVQASMARVVISGMTVSTLITLLLVPAEWQLRRAARRTARAEARQRSRRGDLAQRIRSAAKMAAAGASVQGGIWKASHRFKHVPE